MNEEFSNAKKPIGAEQMETALKTLREFIANNSHVLDAVHVDEDNALSDELHYALHCLDLAYYHLDAAIGELESRKDDKDH